MDGIHDVGGMHGFGPVIVEPDEPVFHAPWEGRVFALPALLIARGVTNVDAFRHAIERLPPALYLTAGYYGRWLAALERLVVEKGIVAGAPLLATPARRPAVRREPVSPPRFGVGEAVVARDLHPAGHTRLPCYVRRRRGVVVRVDPASAFPDTNAHGLGEHREYTYGVRFTTRELWGEDADPRAVVHVDLFESYLEPAR